ncbi:MAG: carboxypeptidase-like regulatory domain-containing protein [Methanothrix sp.]|nr:carboxypeptidase-like regulatory domain-containing protein [Methanothrix sp.]
MKMLQLRPSKKALTVLLLISLLLCTNVAMGSTVQVTVRSGDEVPVPGAAVYIDNEFVGNTWQDGMLRDIPVRPGHHSVRAEWQESSGTDSFDVQIDGYASVNIYLGLSKFG